MIKLGAALLALTLFAGGLIGGRGERAATAAAASDVSAAADSSPLVDEMFATRLKEETAEGNALLLVRFAPGQKIGEQVKTVIDDRDVLLSDDGTGGDEAAGDGTHSAIIFLDFESLAANQDEIQSINAGPEPSPTPSEDPGPTQQSASEAVATEEELADTSLASADSVVMPDFEDTRDMEGLKAEPLADFRNVQPGQTVPLRRIGTHRRVVPEKSLVITNVRVVEDPTRTFNPCNNGNAGEGRFVFGVIDRRPTGQIDPYTGQPAGGCGVTQFTVIFEYGIDRRGCAVRDWGRQWHNLRNYVLGSARYNAELQAITDQFTLANVAPHKPNRSALNQLRTNEIALLLNPPTNPVWELREFKIGGDAGVNPGQLEEATVKLTPDLTRNRTALLTDFVNANEAAILAEQHDVPPTLMGQLFLGGSSLAPRPNITETHWNHPAGGPFINNPQARHKFSLNTCNACHTGETNTAFTHIKPAAFGAEAGLSGFMNGIDPATNTRPFKVNDPAGASTIRKFNEFRRRAIDLDILIHSPCFFDIGRRNRVLVH
ncbi:MAG: hypothetical protein LC800_07505 [Acidobacteria bacterium]|nr:hypothetical protein [Acidobacteriota bacterium]